MYINFNFTFILDFFFPKRNPCRLRAEVSGNLYGVEFPLTYIQLLFVPVKVQIDFLFLKRILFFFFVVIFSSQQHQEHLQLRRYGCCQSCKYELLTLSRFRQEKKKNKTKNPKKLKIVLVILYDGGGRYIYYYSRDYSTDVCFPIPSRRVHMRGWFSFSFLFLSFCGYSVSYTVYYSRDFPFTFYSQEMSRLCRPSTNVNNVYAVYVRSVYICAVFTFEEHPWLFIHVQIACMSKYSAHTPTHSQSENWKD